MCTGETQGRRARCSRQGGAGQSGGGSSSGGSGGGSGGGQRWRRHSRAACIEYRFLVRLAAWRAAPARRRACKQSKSSETAEAAGLVHIKTLTQAARGCRDAGARERSDLRRWGAAGAPAGCAKVVCDTLNAVQDSRCSAIGPVARHEAPCGQCRSSLPLKRPDRTDPRRRLVHQASRGLAVQPRAGLV